ncbi:MAG: C40 family peptidase [Alphaproteobacteria bacterium]|nr:C40 family peptidase [Alphaproteobacteria bacterium]MDE2335960.1 C40 family peptidase [Alphaproteobacteria bacterium]
MQFQIASPVADIHGVPDLNALRGKFETQLVMGEIFDVEEEKDGWCRGSCAHDGYAGFVESRHLRKEIVVPTHIVVTARSNTYAAPSIKSLFTGALSFGSLVRVTGTGQDFMQIAGGNWIYARHIAPAGMTEKDHVATAKKFLETPYYWGGRSGFGIDCSGLVQVCLGRAGLRVPRDSGDQEQAVGKTVDAPQAGDIVFFKGHVGMMADDANLLHANATHMKTVIEPLEDVIARRGEIVSVKRL